MNIIKKEDAQIAEKGRTYIYLGDRLTASQFRGQICQAVLNAEGKCICGRNGVMLVYFPHLHSQGTVLRRRLRKLDKYLDVN